MVLLGSGWLLPLVLAMAPTTIEIDAPSIDAAATERGIRMRLGAEVDEWTIVVRGSGLVSDQLEAELHAPDGTVQRRAIVLSSSRPDDRSRELATALALIVEQHQREPPEPQPPPEPTVATPPAQQTVGLPPAVAPGPPPAVDGWVALGGHAAVGLASPAHAAAGAGLRGGLWLVRDVLQPVIAIDWSRGLSSAPTLDAVRFGAGLAAGASLGASRWWVGAGATPRAAWVRGSDREAATRWVSSTEVAALVQFRPLRGALLALRTGFDLTFPPVRVVGRSRTIEWHEVRWMIALEVGMHTRL